MLVSSLSRNLRPKIGLRLARMGMADAPRPRRIKRAFDLKGNEVSLVVDPLEQSMSEARKEAALAAKIYGNLRGSRGKPKSMENVNKSYEKLADEDINVEEHIEKNFLPPDFDITRIPRFRKLTTGTNHNRHLKNISSALRMATGNGTNSDLVLVESKRLIQEALQMGLHPSLFLFTRLNQLVDFEFDLSKDWALYQVDYRQLQKWSQVDTSPGFLATLGKSEIEAHVQAQEVKNLLPLTVVLDNVRSPDNLGAILRVCAAVGVRKVQCTKGCTNAWQPKVIRAAAGAHFVLRIETHLPWPQIDEQAPGHARVLLADVMRENQSLPENTTNPQLVVGNAEWARRLQQLEEQSRLLATLGSMEDTEESQKDKDDLEDDEEESKMKKQGNDKEKIEDKMVLSQESFTNCAYDDENLLNEYASLPLPSCTHEKLSESFLSSKDDVVLILGGETEGISRQAKKFAHSHLGEHVHIELNEKVNSLNVACAASVLLFELRKAMKRQITTLKEDN